MGSSYDDGDIIYLFGGQGLLQGGGGMGSGGVEPSYPVLNTTILYVPKYIADRNSLNGGEIAGITLGAVVVAGMLVFLMVSLWTYHKYSGYSTAEEDAPDTIKDDELGIEVTAIDFARD